MPLGYTAIYQSIASFQKRKCRYSWFNHSVFIPKLLSSKSFGFEELHSILMKPLRPLWISPSSNSIPSLGDEYYPVYCVSASEMVQDGIDTKYTPNGTSYLYVQGIYHGHLNTVIFF